MYAGRTSGFGKGRTCNRLERITSAPRHEGGGVWVNKKESVRNCVLENTSYKSGVGCGLQSWPLPLDAGISAFADWSIL